MLKDCFEPNCPTVLDPGHTTTNLSRNQLTQFARAVGPEVTLASQGLPEDLLTRSHAFSGWGLRAPPGRSPFTSTVGSTRDDSLVSQSRYSLPTLTSLTATYVSAGVPDTRQMSVSECCDFKSGKAAEVPGLEDVQPAVLLQQE